MTRGCVSYISVGVNYWSFIFTDYQNCQVNRLLRTIKDTGWFAQPLMLLVLMLLVLMRLVLVFLVLVILVLMG